MLMKLAHSVYGGTPLCPPEEEPDPPPGGRVTPEKHDFFGSFSKTISSLSFAPILKQLVVLQTSGQYLKRVGPDFSISI